MIDDEDMVLFGKEYLIEIGYLVVTCELNWIGRSWPRVVVKHKVCLSVNCGS